MNHFLSAAGFFLFMALTPLSRAQDFTAVIRRMPDADAAQRANILRGGTPPPIEYSAKVIPLAPGTPGYVDVSTQHNKVMVLFFFSATCDKCVEASRQISSLFLATSRDEVTVLGVMSSFNSFQASVDVAGKYHLPFPVIQDRANKTFTGYGLTGVPTFCIIGPDGKVAVYCQSERIRLSTLEQIQKIRHARNAPLEGTSPPK